MNYYDKYSKYKTKYLVLKNKITTGGGSKNKNIINYTDFILLDEVEKNNYKLLDGKYFSDTYISTKRKELQNKNQINYTDFIFLDEAEQNKYKLINTTKIMYYYLDKYLSKKREEIKKQPKLSQEDYSFLDKKDKENYIGVSKTDSFIYDYYLPKDLYYLEISKKHLITKNEYTKINEILKSLMVFNKTKGKNENILFYVLLNETQYNNIAKFIASNINKNYDNHLSNYQKVDTNYYHTNIVDKDYLLEQSVLLYVKEMNILYNLLTENNKLKFVEYVMEILKKNKYDKNYKYEKSTHYKFLKDKTSIRYDAKNNKYIF